MDARAMKLAAKVKAVNRANEVGNQLQMKLAEVFRPLVGQQLLKQDGKLLARVAKLLPEMPSAPRLNVYMNNCQFTLAWTVSVNEPNSGDPNGHHTVLYHERSVSVGAIQNGVLTEVHEPLKLRTDYTADEIVRIREVYREAQKVADEAKSALYPFGEYDR